MASAPLRPSWAWPSSPGSQTLPCPLMCKDRVTGEVLFSLRHLCAVPPLQRSDELPAPPHTPVQPFELLSRGPCRALFEEPRVREEP